MNHPLLSVRLIEVNSLFTHQNDRNSFSLFFAIKGDFLCKKTNDQFILSEQEIVLSNSHESLSFYQKNQQNSLLQLTFYFSEVEKVIGEDWRPYFTDYRLLYINEEEKNALVEHIFRLVLDYSEYGVKDQPFARMNRLFAFLDQLNKIVLVEKQVDQDKSFLVSQHPKVMSVIHYIEENYSRRLNLQEVAKREFLSEAYLSRLFKEETGMNFSDYLDKIRLQHAVNDLRHTKLPILTIALNNGFSTGKRFSRLFKEKYKMTPNTYRKTLVVEDHLESQGGQEETDFSIVPEDEMLQVIAQFMLNQDINKGRDGTPTLFELEMNQEIETQLIKPEKIVNIGLAQNGVSEDVREQIRLLQEKISFEYIRFFGLCEEVTQQNYVIMDKFVNNHRLFSFINDMRLKPIIVLEIKDETTFKEWQDQLAYLKKVIQGYVRFEASFKFGWFLEIKLPQSKNTVKYTQMYDYAARFIDNNFTTGFIGLTVSYNQQELFREVYQQLQEKGRQLDFISFNYRDYMIKNKRHKSEYLAFIESLDNLTAWLNKVTTKEKPAMLVTEWNIIASDTHVLSGSFFRSGIVMKSLIQLTTRVKGVGFWLNLESDQSNEVLNQDANLSIFLHGALRRPLFFVLTLFDRVGDQVIEETDNFILTKRFNSYYLLFYNYYYMNPDDTAYQNLWKTAKKEAVFSFDQLKSGRYLVKRFLLDSNHGGIYNQWLKAGGTIELDTDIQEFLYQSVVPDFQVKELEILDGQLEEKALLEINACYLLIMNRITDL